jgi:hypothetical protein
MRRSTVLILSLPLQSAFLGHFFLVGGIRHGNMFKHDFNRTSCIRQQFRKTTVLSCHRCLINTGVEKMNNF